jgi:(5-formylfuran-3-yl)methyl phosphate synthase
VAVSGLLVSVRSAAEAAAALEGGAALIDVKEPAAGPLGRASLPTIAAVFAAVAGRAPVSAALGELAREGDLGAPLWPALAFGKWGLSGLAREDWRAKLAAAALWLGRVTPACQLVTVAYADWRDAGAPPPEEVEAFARERPGAVFLLDTYTKAGSRSLLDFLNAEQVSALCRRCRTAGVRVALAGALGPSQIAELLPTAPDWFAVRGAACDGGRGGTVSARRVRALSE